MGLRRVSLLVVLAAALAWAGSAAAAAPQELTIAAADGTPLACALVEPDGSPPDGGWPGLLLFHGLGGSHANLEGDAETVFAPSGYASLMCDARGTGGSGGSFGLDGPAEVQDVRDLFAWLAARPEVSDTRIGAVGVSLGGGAVWNAAAAGVPFAAIVPAITWTSLTSALAPRGLPKSGVVAGLTSLIPTDRWDPDLLAARQALTSGTDPAEVAAFGAARSPLRALRSLTVPTLLLQGRHDFTFDIGQALTAYRLLRGPKALYLGDLGHAPARNPTAEQRLYLQAAVAWFDRYVKGDPAAPRLPAVSLAHDPWDGTVSTFAALPPTRRISVALPGRTELQSAGRAARRVRLTGGPHETFGAGTLAVRYSGSSGFDRLVATVAVAGSPTALTTGGVRLTKESGVATIRLLDESAVIPRGARLVVTVAATSAGSSPATYVGGVPPGSTISIGRETLTLSVLKRAVSR